MKYFLLLIFLNTQSFAQNMVVVDEISKKPLPHAIVYLDTIGFYTDQNGKLDLNEIKFDSLKINYIGYNSKLLKNPFFKVIDTIFLDKKIETLEEIFVFDKNNKKTKKLKPKPYHGITLFDNTETISCFCSKDDEETFYVKAFTYSLHLNNKYTNTDPELNDSIIHYFRLKVYENNNYNVGQFIKNIETVEIKESSFKNNYRTKLSYNFNDKPLYIGQKGLCIGLEHITIENGIKKKNKFYINSSFSKKSKYFKAKGFLRHPLSIDKKIKPYHELSEDLRGAFLIPEMIIYK